jgi:hypothetical protein
VARPALELGNARVEIGEEGRVSRGRGSNLAARGFGRSGGLCRIGRRGGQFLELCLEGCEAHFDRAEVDRCGVVGSDPAGLRQLVLPIGDLGLQRLDVLARFRIDILLAGHLLFERGDFVGELGQLRCADFGCGEGQIGPPIGLGHHHAGAGHGACEEPEEETAAATAARRLGHGGDNGGTRRGIAGGGGVHLSVDGGRATVFRGWATLRFLRGALCWICHLRISPLLFALDKGQQ